MKVVDVIRLIDTQKAKLAFLAPLITAIGAAVASWAVTGNFDASEIRTAVSGAILAVVSSVAAYLAPAGRAEVKSQSGQSSIELVVVVLVIVILVFVLLRVA